MNINKIGDTHPGAFNRFALNSIVPYFLILGLYSLWVIFGIGGFRTDHVLLLSASTLLYFINADGRKLVQAFGFLLVYWVIFDSIRLFPNYEYNAIHIGDLYRNELSLFGIQTAEGLITANEFFGEHNHTFLDIYTALIYICWIPVPLSFGLYLFITKKRVTVVHFWFAFLMVSVIGLIFQYAYPAAPPWYVELYGPDGAFQKVPGNPGRLINFDRFFGVNLFSGMYNLNANVYAAVPSLHCAFPIIQLFFAIKYKFKGWAIVFTMLMLSTWFSAVYTNHHYIIDVLCGISTALIAIGIYSLLLKTKFKNFLDSYGRKVS